MYQHLTRHLSLYVGKGRILNQLLNTLRRHTCQLLRTMSAKLPYVTENLLSGRIGLVLVAPFRPAALALDAEEVVAALLPEFAAVCTALPSPLLLPLAELPL